MTEHRRRFYHGSDSGRARARTRDLPQKIALKGRRKSPCNEAVDPLKIGVDWNGSCARWAVTGCKHPVPVFSHERSERAVTRGGFAARQRQAGPCLHGPEARPPAYALRAARSRVRGGSPAALCSAKFILCYKVRLLLTSLPRRKSHNDGIGSDEGKGATVDYRELYEKLVGEAEGIGFDREFVDWEVSICDWRADPVAVALHEWIVDNEPAEVSAKAKSQIEWEMRIVGTASERRRECAVESWRKKAAPADDPLLTLGLSNAVRSSENEAMIAEVPDIAI